ncbi:MAG: hypothetical protein DRJ98_08660, partial [Thermoprotei archaeon]
GGARVRPHSLRKYFKTQLTAAGVPYEYVEFMMGHRTSTYLDVKMKGVDHLRAIYARADLSLRPKAGSGKLEVLREIVRSLGLDPDKVLVKEALVEPHRTVVDGLEEALRAAIREAMVRLMVGGGLNGPLGTG